ncbi:MAG: hypothetical protein PHI40_05695 [Caldisericia bacterium]|nr:hypothetical protein [Caldisericia bacterium]MDD4614881.1 hypothetical protein [Caldisericia bacterium]
MNTKDLMDTLVESFEKEGHVRVCFGDPIEKEGITLIPVAKVHTKGGAGSGNANNPKQIQKTHKQPQDTSVSFLETEEQETSTSVPDEPKTMIKGSGVGLDIQVTPLGYIDIKNGEACFKPIKDQDRIAIAGILYAAFTVFLAARTICTVAKVLARKNTKRS